MIGGDIEGQGKIPLSNVKSFLRANQNFHHQDIIDTERAGHKYDVKNLGRQTDTGLKYKPSEIEYITKTYRELYSNRQDKLADYKKQQHYMRAMQKQDFGEQYAYKPQTSLKTSKLAEKKRQSYQTNTTKIEERLIIAQKYNDDKKQLKKDQFMEDRKRETPFQP